MIYHGVQLAYVIDDLDGVEASYRLAGCVGFHPRGLTLRRLWQMHDARERARRETIVEQASLVWNLDKVDIFTFIEYGYMHVSNRGGPPELSEKLEAKVEAEVQRLREKHPDLPKVMM